MGNNKIWKSKEHRAVALLGDTGKFSLYVEKSSGSDALGNELWVPVITLPADEARLLLKKIVDHYEAALATVEEPV
jgi:hypothetical protein